MPQSIQLVEMVIFTDARNSILQSILWTHTVVRTHLRRPRMTIARAQLVDASLTRWYHCVTRCVCKAFLLGERDQHRKQWIKNRLENADPVTDCSGLVSQVDRFDQSLGLPYSNVADAGPERRTSSRAARASFDRPCRASARPRS